MRSFHAAMTVCRAPRAWARACGRLAAFAVAVGVLGGLQHVASGGDKPTEKAKPAEKDQPAEKAQKAPFAWKSLFDGKTLKGWKAPVFGGEGKVYVENGAIVMEMGDPMTGVTWTGGELPKTNYELRLDAERTMGGDFFATTTFPVGDKPCSFVVGGWAGTVVGLSCVDWYDASDNITTSFMAFDDNKWYHIRIRVTDAKIECWIDDEKLVDLPREGHKFSIRAEVDLCVPLGIATYITEGRVRNIRLRRLKPEEVAAAAKESKD